jgi:SAM-dependent methyltransferase
MSGSSYENYMGRWSRRVARDFVDWLAVPAGARWLDVGCGTGALTRAILDRAGPAAVDGVDPSDAFVRHASQELAGDSRARFQLADAQELPFERGSVDIVVSGLVLNFISDPGNAVVEMARVTKTNGTVAGYVWDYSGEMQLLRAFWDAAVELDPAAEKLDEGRRFPIAGPEPLAQTFAAAQLRDVSTRAIDTQTVFPSFDDYWQPFLGGQGPAGAYAVSLDSGKQGALRERVRGSLPDAGDGSISLVARAWAVRGRK